MAPTTTLWYRHRGPNMTFKSNQQCIVGCIYVHLKKNNFIMAPTIMIYVNKPILFIHRDTTIFVLALIVVCFSVSFLCGLISSNTSNHLPRHSGIFGILYKLNPFSFLFLQLVRNNWPFLFTMSGFTFYNNYFTR
jgi:hypothetical protein